MYKVLTVDLDWLLGNMQEKWADIDGGDDRLTQNQNWQVISWLTKIPLKDIKADRERLFQLGRYLFDCASLNPDANIHIVQDHHDVYPYLNGKENIYLVNIDHHHDILYSDSLQETVNCGNWVYHLARQGKLVHYFWICNTESNDYQFNKEFNIDKYCPFFRKTWIKETRLKDIAERFDAVFIIKSRGYAPKVVQKLAEPLRCIFIEGTVKGVEVDD